MFKVEHLGLGDLSWPLSLEKTESHSEAYPHLHVNWWCCHYVGLIWATILLRIHGWVFIGSAESTLPDLFEEGICFDHLVFSAMNQWLFRLRFRKWTVDLTVLQYENGFEPRTWGGTQYLADQKRADNLTPASNQRKGEQQGSITSVFPLTLHRLHTQFIWMAFYNLLVLNPNSSNLCVDQDSKHIFFASSHLRWFLKSIYLYYT